LLSKEINDLDYLNSIGDACLDNELSFLNIFTLNQDTILERYLSQRNIDYEDGFGSPINRVRYWSPDSFEETSSKVRLYKLHGSVNWFQLKPDEGSFGYEKIGIPLDKDIWHTRDPGGKMQMPVDGHPMFLAGTFNKLLQYTSGIYAELHCQLHRNLRFIPVLIVSGYGFGDKGINTRIIEWMYYLERNTMVLIHSQPEQLKRGARGAIRKNWNNWLRNKKLVLISKWIEQTSWKEIRDVLAKQIQ
jgi:hypothetical protein